MLDNKLPLSSFTDVQLLELLCSEINDQPYFSEFAKRFSPYLVEECNKICRARKLDLHVGKQIVNEALERVRRYKSFKIEKIKLSNDRRAIIVYLNRICTRLFNDHHRKEKSVDINHRSYFDDLTDSINPNINRAELKNKKDTAIGMFNKLNKKEQRVILVDIENKKHHKYLPDEVNVALSTELGVQVATIRKIRERAIAKIKTAINEINEG